MRTGDWSRLLSLETQPAALRECYELVELFVSALGTLAPVSEAGLGAEERARLGYLITAARLIGGVDAHASWVDLQERLQERLQEGQPPAADIVLLAADPGRNPFDDLARLWGLRKGLDTIKLTQIAEHGAS